MTAIDDAEVVSPVGMPLNRLHGEYAHMTAPEIAALARKKLADSIEKSRVATTQTIERMLSEVPRDYVMAPKAMQLKIEDGRILSGKGLDMHTHAIDQLVDRVDMTRKFQRTIEPHAWGQELLVHNLNTLLAHRPDKERVLVRTVNGTVRGVLSDSYRRIDTRPALEALMTVARNVGAVITAGYSGDIKASFKVVLPNPIEVYPGEWAVFGLDYSNSDYGAGARELSAWILRLLCINGAQVVTNYRKVHLGRRLEDGIQYANDTYAADARATALQTRDLAQALLGPQAVEAFVQQVRAAAETPVDAEKELRSLKGRLNKGEEKTVRDAYVSADIVELPAGQTKWRFSNALSWLAKNTEDGLRRLEVERIAGEYIGAPAPAAA